MKTMVSIGCFQSCRTVRFVRLRVKKLSFIHIMELNFSSNNLQY